MANPNFNLKKNQNLLLFVFVGVVVFLYFLFFLNKGITLYDEGYIVESSYLTFLGKIPYKDFYFQYTPLTAWLGALTFSFFGVGILQLRWLSLLYSLLTVLAGFAIANKIAGNKIAFLTALALTAWGFPHANFLWPSSLATLFLFLTLFAFLNFYQTKSIVYAGLTGLFVALTLLTKQNLGAILFVTSGVFVLLFNFQKDFKGKVWTFFPVFVLVLFSGFLILIYKNSHFLGFSEFFYRSGLIAKGGTLLTWYPGINLPALSSGQFVKWFVKTFLYYSPVIFTVYSLFTFIKYRRAKILNLSIFTIASAFFFTMIWPTADLAHFTFAVPSLIILFLVGTQLEDKILRRSSVLLLLFFIFIGFYKIFFMSYYTFETPYLKLEHSVSVRGEKIIVDEKHFVIIDTLNKEKDTIFKNKAVFVYSYAPMVYFILDKIPPTPELYTVEGLLSKDAIANVTSDLDKNKVDFVLLESWRESHSDITKFIRENYRNTENIWDFEVLGRQSN